jgi:hypothetical protein
VIAGEQFQSPSILIEQDALRIARAVLDFGFANAATEVNAAVGTCG